MNQQSTISDFRRVPILAPKPNSRTKILVVDDDPGMRESIAQALQLSSYDVIEAANGFSGLTQAHEHRPDLIVSDHEMSGLSGLKMLSLLRNTRALASVPFILVTGQGELAGHRQSMNLGADDYLTKPILIADLLGAVRSCLAKASVVREQSERKLDELRVSLIRMLPHELNTPLVGICGLAEALHEGLDQFSSGDVLEMLRLIQESGERLTRTVQNYLSVAGAELQPNQAGIAILRGASTDHAGELACEAAERAAERFKRRADLRCQVEPNISATIAPEYLAKILDELVDNACKFSVSGTPIRLNARIRNTLAEFVLTDEGCGMRPQHIACIGAFIQFDRPHREQQGSGLGLYVARRIAEMHGGALVIISRPGSGTTVTVQLPATSKPKGETSDYHHSDRR